MSSAFLWTLLANPTAAMKWSLIINYRNSMLSQSDWTQLPDAILTLAEKSAWEDYRQALRDIPQNYVNPDDVIFPEVPA